MPYHGLALAIATNNLPTKFEVCISTHYEDMKVGLASISLWSRSDRLLYSTITVDQKQDWSRSWA